jgi:hypothetical protein
MSRKTKKSHEIKKMKELWRYAIETKSTMHSQSEAKMKRISNRDFERRLIHYITSWINHSSLPNTMVDVFASIVITRGTGRELT